MSNIKMDPVFAIFVMLAFIFSVVAVGANSNNVTIISGKIYNENNNDPFTSGADITIRCREITQTTESLSDGSYNSTFTEANCPVGSDVTINATSGSLSGYALPFGGPVKVSACQDSSGDQPCFVQGEDNVTIDGFALGNLRMVTPAPPVVVNSGNPSGGSSSGGGGGSSTSATTITKKTNSTNSTSGNQTILALNNTNSETANSTDSNSSGSPSGITGAAIGGGAAMWGVIILVALIILISYFIVRSRRNVLN